MKKKVMISSLTAIVLLGGVFLLALSASRNSKFTQATNSRDTRDTVIAMLLYSEIQKNIDAYYKPYFNTPLDISPEFITISNIKRASSGYDVTLQVSPYLGAHNDVGEDIITINVTSNSVATREFKHINSYSVPEWLKQYVIKWPPENG